MARLVRHLPVRRDGGFLHRAVQAGVRRDGGFLHRAIQAGGGLVDLEYYACFRIVASTAD